MADIEVSTLKEFAVILLAAMAAGVVLALARKLYTPVLTGGAA